MKNKENYVSLETSKLLKEKGMNKSCFKHYVQKNNNDGTSEAVAVCTLQMAIKMAEWKGKKMIEKAVEWLINNVNNYIINDNCNGKYRDWFKVTSNCFDDFRKEMEK